MSTVTVDNAVIASWLQPGGMIDRDSERRAKAVVFEAKIRAPVRTGALRDSGTAQPSSDGIPGGWDAVFAIYYAWFVDQGTVFMDPRWFLTYSLPAAIR